MIEIGVEAWGTFTSAEDGTVPAVEIDPLMHVELARAYEEAEHGAVDESGLYQIRLTPERLIVLELWFGDVEVRIDLTPAAVVVAGALEGQRMALVDSRTGHAFLIGPFEGIPTTARGGEE